MNIEGENIELFCYVHSGHKFRGYKNPLTKAFRNHLPYVGKFWSGKKLANLANCGLFANILPANNFFTEIQNYFSN